jgi:hypothetical protein
MNITTISTQETYPPFLGEAFSPSELRLILIEMLNNSKLRSHLVRLQTGRAFKGSSTQIALRLDEAGCMQVILLETDAVICETIDRLIAKHAINVPVTEIRRVRNVSDGPSGWYAVSCEASHYGVRLRSSRGGVPLARLKRLIREVHGQGNSSDLSWRLRFTSGDSTSQKLDTYANDHSPEEALHEHLLATPATLGRAFELFRFGSFSIPANLDEEQVLLKRMMWKLGFSVPDYPLEYRTLDQNIKRLQEANQRSQVATGGNRAEIRGEAANLFVELERFLSDSLMFMTWVRVQAAG